MNTTILTERRRNLAALVIAVAVAASIVAAAAAFREGSPASEAQKPTIVLVHGAWGRLIRLERQHREVAADGLYGARSRQPAA
jgi:hypothetical protein